MPRHAVPVAVARRGSKGSAPFAPREREERAARDVPAAAAPPEQGERAGHTVTVAATPRERSEASVLSAPSTVHVAVVPPEFSPFPSPPVPAQRRDSGRDAANDCY